MKEYIDRSMSFANYVELIDGLLLEGKTTGPNQSEELLHYAKLNRQRMRRLEATAAVSEKLKASVALNGRKMIWLVITEGWCGDAAQNIPIIEKIAAESVNIETRYILRDENLELMDRFLTNGGRSIPKLVALDAKSYKVLGTWGPRPAAAQARFDELKSQGADKEAMMESLQRWYNADKNGSIQAEFEVLLGEWAKAAKASAAGGLRMPALFSFGTFL